METKLISQEKNLFLERKELILEIRNKTTPTLDEVKLEIGKDIDLTVIKKINTNFGKQIFLTEAVIYDNIEAKEKVETIPKKVRKKIEADRKEEESKKKKEEEDLSKENNNKVEVEKVKDGN